MSLELDNILITGRTYSEYMAFFDLDEKEIKGKKVLDCPSGASSFVADAKEKDIKAKGVDILYRFDIENIKQQGKKSIEKIYDDVSWMEGFNFDFYKSIKNHRKYREEALNKFCKDFNRKDYIHIELPKLDFKDNSFDLLLSSHLLFVYDDRFSYEFHKNSILEMLRVAREVRIFPLVDFQNKRMDREENFSPYVYRIIDELKKEYSIGIEKVNFEFQPRANYMLKLIKN